MVDLHEKGLIKTLLDTQSFDGDAARSLAQNPNHVEISTNQYASPGSKGSCERERGDAQRAGNRYRL
jgi:citrate lyase subunit alpha/citrate CoA-transferase